jgi:hypothetical protein
VAPLWPRQSGDASQEQRANAGQRTRNIALLQAIHADHRRSSVSPAQPVTPEVAGSSPVAPAPGEGLGVAAIAHAADSSPAPPAAVIVPRSAVCGVVGVQRTEVLVLVVLRQMRVRRIDHLPRSSPFAEPA